MTKTRPLSMQPRLILASTSKYRARLLLQLGVSFEQKAPTYEEIAIEGEDINSRAARFAFDKAATVAKNIKDSHDYIVIGSDQIAHTEHQILHKPGSFEHAQHQLSACTGKWVTFTTAVCLLSNKGDVLDHAIDHYQIKYRSLNLDEIRHYLEVDTPYDCAGSIKAEGYGITIIDKAHGQDVNTLYGLPLMKLATLLPKHGISLLSDI